MKRRIPAGAVALAALAVAVAAPALAQQSQQQKPAAPAAAAPKPAAPAAAPKPAAPAAAAPRPAAPKPAASAQASASPTTGAQLLGQFGDWGAYTASPGGKKVCFALAKPNASSTNPPNRPRDPAFLFVSTRPTEKVREEVSVIIGYPFKPASDAAAEIGATSFALYTQNDGAWIKNAAEEARMVEAMKKGADVTVKGVSGRGTRTTDVFSLKGLAQALDRVASECR
ncbi:MAG: invasion associated locus B family protein [Pseudorhodoplanes sp.]